MTTYFLPTDGRITQYYETPVDYIAGRTFHGAIDIVTKGPMPLIALADGVITNILDGKTEGIITGYGNQIYLTYNSVPQVDRFCHCKRGIPVHVGQKVSKGEVIGYTGRTGYRVPLSTYHCHLESRVDGVLVDPLTAPLQDYLKNPNHNFMADFSGVRQIAGTGEILIHPDYAGADPIALTLSILARANHQPLLRQVDADHLVSQGWFKYQCPYMRKPFSK